MSEGMVLAMKSGLDTDKVLEALSAGMARSAVLEMRAKNMIEDNYPLGFKLSLHLKDLRIALSLRWSAAITRARSAGPSPMPATSPVIGSDLVADYLCQQVPVCVPQPFCKLQDCQAPKSFTSPPDPYGPGNKDEDYRRVSGAGVDSMKVTLRAATICLAAGQRSARPTVHHPGW